MAFNLRSVIPRFNQLEYILRITIQARNFALTNALRSHIERRLRYALTQHDNHIRSVLVRLSDINGPRGGADKRCHILEALEQLSDVVVKDTKVDLCDAINCAGGCADRTVALPRTTAGITAHWWSAL